MRTRLKRFIAVNIHNKIDIRKHQKLFLAAVVLFCLPLAVFSPLMGIEHLLFMRRFKENNAAASTIAKPQQSIQSAFSANGLYLSASTLTSIANYSDESDAEDNYANNESSLIIVQKNALLIQANPVTIISQQSRDKIINYLVQEGDTPISIAAAYGITANTLLWANNFSSNSIIRPGDELTIPPVSGVIHRVKSGDTIDAIAKKYSAKGKDIITFNELPADGAIGEGQKLIVPDGQMPAPPKPKLKIAPSRSYASIIGEGTGLSRNFPWGQCTWYVAQKRIVTWSGNAKSWLANALAQGYQTGNTAQVGAIVALNEGGWMGRLYGHVAYVESVQNGWVTISEMNYRCLGCRSVRTISIHDKDIRGYIY